jgi:hypothetical protein
MAQHIPTEIAFAKGEILTILTATPRNTRDIARLAQHVSGGALRDEVIVKKALAQLVREGKAVREVRRQFVGVQNAAFPSGASRLVREAQFRR